MTASAVQAPRFVRRTELAPHEYRKNFRQIDADTISALTSREADSVTPLMSKIYLRLLDAPAPYRERDGVLRFTGEVGDDGRHLTAWQSLCRSLGVASATAGKALRWMHEQGVIGYFSGKNGVGIRIFLNRASSSIGTRGPGQKILAFRPAAEGEARASAGEAAFKDSYAVGEVLDSRLNRGAPPDGAGPPRAVTNHAGRPAAASGPPAVPVTPAASALPAGGGGAAGGSVAGWPAAEGREGARVAVAVGEVVARLKAELEPWLREAARREAAREHERTREWLESRGLPKAARVAQREAFNLLRLYGLVKGRAVNTFVHGGAGRDDSKSLGPQPLSDEEADEMAHACVAMLVAQGRSIEQTLSEMSAEVGGFMLPADAARVRARAEALLASAGEGRSG